MFGNFSIFHFLVYATAFGFIAATVYTNIQRTALSKFITYLIQNKSIDESSAALLSDIKLNFVEKSIIKSAVRSQNGLKRCIGVIKSSNSTEDRLEAALEGNDCDKYYLTSDKTEELSKKYSYKTLPLKYIILFVAALCIVVVSITAAVEWLINKVTIPTLEDNSDTEITEQNDNTITDFEEEIENNGESDDQNDSDVDTNKENPYKDNTAQDSEGSGGPRIPVLK